MTAPEAPITPAERRLIPSETIDLLGVARVAHAANMILRDLLGQPPSPEWHAIPPQMMEGFLEAVIMVRDGEYRAREMHDLWRESRESTGWTLGPYDFDGRTHPNLVDYDQLPDHEQVKDVLFVAIVSALDAITT